MIKSAALWLALAHSPSWAPFPFAQTFATPGAAVAAFLSEAHGVVAFGELHQTAKTASVRSTIARFTDEILPAVAPRAAHLIVETWVSRGTCGEPEKRVTEDVARTTERPPATENEIVRLLRRAKELGVAPHVLDVDCHEYQTILTGNPGRVPAPSRDGLRRAEPGSVHAVQVGDHVDYDRLLKLTRAHLQRAIEQALALPHPPDRPLVLVYGGALHNDLEPAPALADYSFGPAIDRLTGGDYREMDLYVPELVDALPALRAERWYPVWVAAQRANAGTLEGSPLPPATDSAGGSPAPSRRPGTTLLIRRGPRSAIVLFQR